MSQWIEHVKQTRAKHGCSYKEALKLASKTYARKSGGVTTPYKYEPFKYTPMRKRPATEEPSSGAVTDTYDTAGTEYEEGAYGNTYSDNTAPTTFSATKKKGKKKVSGLKALGRKLRGLF